MASTYVRLLAKFTLSARLGSGRKLSHSALLESLKVPTLSPAPAPHATWRLPPLVASSLPPADEIASLPLACAQGYLSRPSWLSERDNALLRSYSDALATPRDLLALDALCTALGEEGIGRLGIVAKTRGPRSRSLAPHSVGIDSGDSSAFAAFLAGGTLCFEALFGQGVPSLTRVLDDGKDSKDVMLMSPELHASFRAAATGLAAASASTSTSSGQQHRIRVVASRIVDAHIVWEDVTAEPVTDKVGDLNWDSVSVLGRSLVVSGQAAHSGGWFTRMIAQFANFYGLRTASRAAAQVTVAFSCQEERDDAPSIATLHTLTFEGAAAAPPTVLPLPIRLAFGIPRLELSFPWVIVDVDGWFAAARGAANPIIAPSTIPLLAAAARVSSRDLIAHHTRAALSTLSGGQSPLNVRAAYTKRVKRAATLTLALKMLATALAQTPRGTYVLSAIATPLSRLATGPDTDTMTTEKSSTTSDDDGALDTLAITLQGARDLAAACEVAVRTLLSADGPPWAARLDAELAAEAASVAAGVVGTPASAAPLRTPLLGGSLVTGQLPPVLASPAAALPSCALRQFLSFYWLTRSRAQQVDGELSVAHRDAALLSPLAYLSAARAAHAAAAASSSAEAAGLSAVKSGGDLSKLIKELDEALLREAVNAVPLPDDSMAAIQAIEDEIVMACKNVARLIAAEGKVAA